MQLPDGNGLDFLKEIKDGTPVIIITAYGDVAVSYTHLTLPTTPYV